MARPRATAGAGTSRTIASTTAWPAASATTPVTANVGLARSRTTSGPATLPASTVTGAAAPASAVPGKYEVTMSPPGASAFPARRNPAEGFGTARRTYWPGASDRI